MITKEKAFEFWMVATSLAQEKYPDAVGVDPLAAFKAFPSSLRGVKEPGLLAVTPGVDFESERRHQYSRLQMEHSIATRPPVAPVNLEEYFSKGAPDVR